MTDFLKSRRRPRSFVPLAFALGIMSLSAGDVEISVDGSTLIAAVNVSEAMEPSPATPRPRRQETSVPNSTQILFAPDLSEQSSDIDASTVPAKAPSFRMGTALRDMSVRPSAHADAIPSGAPPPAAFEANQAELNGIALDIYDAFAASDSQFAASRARAKVTSSATGATGATGAAPTGSIAVDQATASPQPAVSDLMAVPIAPAPAVNAEVAPAAPLDTIALAQAAVDAPPNDLPVDGGTAQDVITPAQPLTPSQNVTVNLINRLVQRGFLTKEDAAELIQQAEADAQIAQSQSQAMQVAIAETAAAQTALAQSIQPPAEGTVRVTHVPEVVKKQIKNEIRDDLMAQAKSESWAAPRLLPPWVESIHPFADIRVRFEGDFFPPGNDNTGAFPNFNAINTGPPFDVTGNQFSPQWNVDQNRYRVRLRARAGVGMDLGENFSAGLRLATGENNSPVSQNQSMGLANQGQGGNFSKYAIWLDRAFIKWELAAMEEERKVAITAGRFDNPFFTVSEIMWDNDIGFDGIALQAEYEVFEGFTPFVNGGIFPVFNTDFNFSSNQPAKFASEDKWLAAGQLGFKWDISDDFALTLGAAYYYFYNVEGRLSSPFTPLSQNDAGDTDNTRPSFAQKGNTYMALRDIVPDASNDFGTINQWQYYGLATPYQDIVLSGKLEYKGFEPIVISVSGEFAKNLAFKRSDIEPIAVNNRGANDDDLSNSIGAFAGGDTAWIVQLTVGKPKLEKRWDWNVTAGYRYVESDAVIDGFNDSDFGGGGTNLKGYTIAGHLALSPNVWIGIRWLSAESIAGPPYKEDIIQFDLNSKF